MARRKIQEDDVADSPGPRSSRKRSVDDGEQVENDDDTPQRTPSKRQRRVPRTLKDYDIYDVPDDDAALEEATMEKEVEVPEPTPTPKRKRGRPPKNATPLKNGTVTPSKPKQPRGSAAATPVKSTGLGALTPRRRKAVDRSAKRKSARALIERVVGDEASDEEDEEGLVREIYDSSEDEEEEEDREEGANGADGAAGTPRGPTTPSRTPGRRGRPPKVRSPTPPRDLPPHEVFFEHNKPGRAKTSNNTLASLDLLTHEEYFAILKDYKDSHEENVAFLESLHRQSFGQWLFELSQGFSVCLFGLGSKRDLMKRFAEQAYAQIQDHRSHKIVIVNGYVQTITLRDILTTIISALDLDSSIKVPAHPQAMLQALLAHLSSDTDTRIRRLTLLLNSIDSPALRKSSTQQALALLAAHPRLRLICSADTPDFPLLWDAALRASFNFAFHDATTFAAPAAELDPVDDVHDLLGRRARAVNGKEGVAFVLRSLPENAKNLFRLLVTEVLVAADDDDDNYGESPGVEYRMLYNKALEEFICSSEMAFRTLLKEFHDHQMIVSRKDALGTELLSAPFRKEELEAILEDLMT